MLTVTADEIFVKYIDGSEVAVLQSDGDPKDYIPNYGQCFFWVYPELCAKVTFVQGKLISLKEAREQGAPEVVLEKVYSWGYRGMVVVCENIFYPFKMYRDNPPPT